MKLQAIIERFSRFLTVCRTGHSSVAWVLLQSLYFRFLGKNIYAGNGVQIRGPHNIHTNGRLFVALNNAGFMCKRDRTLISIRGAMQVSGDFSIGRGCRIDIGSNAQVTLASGYINSNCLLIIMNGLTIGADCAISWGCQFLDDDFHIISYAGRQSEENKFINIGNHVWIGSNVTVLKGASLANGTVVASGSVVRNKFVEENTLIAGNPAKIIRRDITWV